MINLLLADDHQIIRDGIKLMLTNYNEINIVFEASNGNEVINYLQNERNKVDVVLMDINMPYMDGVEAMKIIDKSFNEVKVLALTMHSDETFISKMLDAGALGYVLKEIGISELVVAIKSVARGDKYLGDEVYLTLKNSLKRNRSKSFLELTSRELSVLSCVSKGLTNKEIGEKLFISARTVESHRQNIIGKLDVKNTAEMIRYAIENKILK